MKFIHISDIHLGRLPDPDTPWGEERAEELWLAFSKVTKVCVDQGVDLLLISGDLFDHPPDRKELDRANQLLADMENVHAVIVSGPHDYVRKGGPSASYKWAENVHFIAEDTPTCIWMEDIDTAVYGISYSSPECTDTVLERLHADDEGGVQILLANGGDPEHYPFRPEILGKAGFTYVALGGQHTPKLFASKNAAFAGSLEPLDPKETGKHGYIIGEAEEKQCEVMFVPFSLREYMTLNVRVTNNITMEELKMRLKEVIRTQGEDNIYQVILEGRYRPGHPYRTALLLGLGRISRIDDRTIPDYNVMAILDEHKDDAVGMYMEELMKQPADKKLQRALYRGLDALLLQEDSE